MQYSVLSVLILIRLVYLVAGQSPPTTSTPSPTPKTDGATLTSTTGGSATPISTLCTNPNNPGSTTPNSDNLSCIENLLSLCEAYRFQFKKTTKEYGCTMFTNTYIYSFHSNLVMADSECDTIMQLETMRQKVMGYSNGQPGISTHAFMEDADAS